MASITFHGLSVAGDSLSWQSVVTVTNGLPSWTTDYVDCVGICIDGSVLTLFEINNELYIEGS